jgi:tetratricopeptide (TPR) repeat protein
VLLGAAAWWFLRPPAPVPEPELVEESVADPRDTFPTPFRNVKASVAFVGDDSKCAACHPTWTASYHAHPMARSAAWMNQMESLERFDPSSHPAFEAQGYRLSVAKGADAIQGRMTFPGLAEVYRSQGQLAIGSGTRGRSYLSVESGSVWQSPISWFTHAGRWDVSPGFDLGSGGRRAILAECLFCHVDRVDPVPGATNRYREPVLPGQAAIGCERCHGPASLHLAERANDPPPAGQPDTSIVNPKHLSAGLQAAICAQCHLQAQARIPIRGRTLFQYRPGLPLELFVTVFVRHPDLADLQQSVGQFEQVKASRCVTTAGEKLECTTCHDPHSYPDASTRLRYYRTKCVECHTGPNRECSAPPAVREKQEDSCTTCHMPSRDSSNIAHASVTDHRILRKPLPPPRPPGLSPDVSPLVPFRLGRQSTGEEELERQHGIGLARSVAGAGANARLLAGMASARLDASLALHSGDAEAWLALSTARHGEGNPQAAYQAAVRATKLAPTSDPALGAAAESAILLEKWDEALTFSTRLVERNPSAVEPLVTRATMHLGRRDWAAAERDCDAALRIHPLHPQAQLLRAVAWSHLGRTADAQKEAENAAALAGPARREAVLEWYRRQAR